MLIDSSRVTRSAGSRVVPSPPVDPPSRSGSGSRIHSPTYRSRLAQAEPSRSRQMRLATFVGQPPGDSMASRCCGDMAYQRA